MFVHYAKAALLEETRIPSSTAIEMFCSIMQSPIQKLSFKHSQIWVPIDDSRPICDMIRLICRMGNYRLIFKAYRG